MKAEQARFVSDQHNHTSFEEHLTEAMAEAADPGEFLAEVVWAILVESIQAKAHEGRRTNMLEPFAMIPGKLHPEERETSVIGRIAIRLEAGGYTNVEWDRRDKRVVLKFEW